MHDAARHGKKAMHTSNREGLLTLHRYALDVNSCCALHIPCATTGDISPHASPMAPVDGQSLSAKKNNTA